MAKRGKRCAIPSSIAVEYKGNERPSPSLATGTILSNFLPASQAIYRGLPSLLMFETVLGGGGLSRRSQPNLWRPHITQIHPCSRSIRRPGSPDVGESPCTSWWSLGCTLWGRCEYIGVGGVSTRLAAVTDRWQVWRERSSASSEKLSLLLHTEDSEVQLLKVEDLVSVEFS